MAKIKVARPTTICQTRSHAPDIPDSPAESQLRLDVAPGDEAKRFGRGLNPAEAAQFLALLKEDPASAVKEWLEIETAPSSEGVARLAEAIRRGLDDLASNPPLVGTNEVVGRVSASSAAGPCTLTITVEGAIRTEHAPRIELEVDDPCGEHSMDSWWLTDDSYRAVAAALVGEPHGAFDDDDVVTMCVEPGVAKLRLFDEMVEETGFDGWFAFDAENAQRLSRLLRQAIQIAASSPPVLDRGDRTIAEIEL